MSNETSLVLRVCRADLTSRAGFRYPAEVGATIESPDWSDEPSCGKGLHGWLHGQGYHSCADYWSEEAAKWLVLEVVSAHIIMLGGKCKFPRATVRFIGGKSEAAAYLMANSEHAKNVAVIGASIEAPDKGHAVVGDLGTATAGRSGTATAGDSGTATAGYSGTATAGYSGTATAGRSGTATAGDSGTATAGYSGTATAGRYGTATAGYSGTATAGYSGTATAGRYGTATAGDSGTATAGYSGTATAGRYGTATAGDSGTATAGYSGTATAGDSGTATAGYSGTATAGYSGTATAGEKGEIRIKYWDEEAERYRTKIGYIGEDGLLPDVAYNLDESLKFVEAK